MTDDAVLNTIFCVVAFIVGAALGYYFLNDDEKEEK